MTACQPAVTSSLTTLAPFQPAAGQWRTSVAPKTSRTLSCRSTTPACTGSKARSTETDQPGGGLGIFATATVGFSTPSFLFRTPMLARKTESLRFETPTFRFWTGTMRSETETLGFQTETLGRKTLRLALSVPTMLQRMPQLLLLDLPIHPSERSTSAPEALIAVAVAILH